VDVVKGFVGVVVISFILLAGRSVCAATRSFNTTTMTVARVVPLPAQAGISHATGICNATLNDQTGEVSFSGSFAGLNAPPTAVHVRGPAGEGAGPAPVIVPASTFTAAVSGTFSGSGTVTPDLVSAMISGLAYCEVRDTPNFPSGEVRGQLVSASPVPAVPPWALAILSMTLVGGAVRVLRERALRSPI